MERGEMTMCWVVDALMDEGAERGRLEGKIELLSEMDYSVPEIATRLEISEQKVNEILHRQAKLHIG